MYWKIKELCNGLVHKQGNRVSNKEGSRSYSLLIMKGSVTSATTGYSSTSVVWCQAGTS